MRVLDRPQRGLGDRGLLLERVRLPGRYENLVKISEFVRLAAQEAGLDSFAIYSVETAVERGETVN